MDNAQEYYNQTNTAYVTKWQNLSQQAQTPSHWSRQQLMQEILQLAQPKVVDKVIEVGCGTGLLLKEILHFTPQVWGTDISAGMLRQVAAHTLINERVIVVEKLTSTTATENSGYNVFLAVNDILALDLPSAYFDKILSTEVLRYVADKEKALQQLANIMKPETILVFTISNLWSWSFFPIKFQLRKFLGLVRPQELQQYFVTEKQLTRKLAASGLEIVKLQRFGFFTFNPWWRRLIKSQVVFDKWYQREKKLADKPFFRRFFDTFIVVAKLAK